MPLARGLVLAVLPFLALAAKPEDCDSSVCTAVSVDVFVQPESVVRRGQLSDFFSFNLNHFGFERDILQSDGTIATGPIADLRAFKGNFLRYPGGLVSNNFQWDTSIGPAPKRQPQKSVKHAAASPVLFGIDEYASLLKATGSKPWYVLNLAGWSDTRLNVELPTDEVVESNARLARYLRDTIPVDGPRYYQLGNELDRSVYQWPVEKYAERARASIRAIRKIDGNSRFVAFLRDFDWKYKGGSDPRVGTLSRYEDFIPAVLSALPEVDDFSLHFYYDDPGVDRHFKKIGWRLRQIGKAIDLSRKSRGGMAPDVWITEHARGVNLPAGNGMQRAYLTSNLAAAISTADFLIGITQIPEIKGAFWHGVNAGPWQLFDASIKYGDLRPRPLYWGLRILRSVLLDETLVTTTANQPTAQYADGYDIRAAAFRSNDKKTFGLWVANRRDESVAINLHYKPLSSSAVAVTRYQIYGPSGIDPDAEELEISIDSAAITESGSFDESGRIQLVLEPSSVTAFEIRMAPGKTVATSQD